MSSGPVPIRILFIIDYFHRTGGTETHLALLTRALVADGFHCEVVVFDLGDNPLIEQMRAAGVVVHSLPVAREYTPHALGQALKLARLIRARGFDIVQTFHQKADTYGALVARLAGVRHLISSKRDTGHLRAAHHFFLNRRLRSLFEKTIVVADAVAAAVQDSNRVDPATFVKIYNGVDCQRFRPPGAAERAAARARFGLGEQDFVAGIVAGFRPEKNHALLFESALAARARIPGLRVLAVGAGPLLEEMRRRYAHADPLFVYAGDVQDVTGALAAMDVGCLVPDRNEGFSNAVVEKMAMGLPVIVTDVGGNAEAVVDAENGFIIGPRDGQRLTELLVRLHEDIDLRRAMGQRSRELAEQRFSLRQMCRRHADLYLQLLSTPDTARVASGSGSSVNS